MSTTFKTAVDCYLRAKTLSRGTSNEYRSTVRKWEQWGCGPPIEGVRPTTISTLSSHGTILRSCW